MGGVCSRVECIRCGDSGVERSEVRWSVFRGSGSSLRTSCSTPVYAPAPVPTCTGATAAGHRREILRSVRANVSVHEEETRTSVRMLERTVCSNLWTQTRITASLHGVVRKTLRGWRVREGKTVVKKRRNLYEMEKLSPTSTVVDAPKP